MDKYCLNEIVLYVDYDLNPKKKNSAYIVKIIKVHPKQKYELQVIKTILDPYDFNAGDHLPYNEAWKNDPTYPVKLIKLKMGKVLYAEKK